MRINIEKIQKLVANLHDNNEHIILLRNLKQALNNELVLKKVHGETKCYENSWIKPYIHLNTDLG